MRSKYMINEISVRRVLSIKVLFVLILFVMQATDSIAEKTVLPDINSLELVPLQFNEGQNKIGRAHV